MHQPDLGRWFRHGRHPIAQGLLVGMGRVACQVLDGGFQGFGLPVPAVFHFLVQPGDPDAQWGIDVSRRHREPVQGYLRIMALGNAAVVVRLKRDQVAGTGDAGFSTEMGDGDDF